MLNHHSNYGIQINLFISSCACNLLRLHVTWWRRKFLVILTYIRYYNILIVHKTASFSECYQRSSPYIEKIPKPSKRRGNLQVQSAVGTWWTKRTISESKSGKSSPFLERTKRSTHIRSLWPVWKKSGQQQKMDGRQKRGNSVQVHFLRRLWFMNYCVLK